MYAWIQFQHDSFTFISPLIPYCLKVISSELIYSSSSVTTHTEERESIDCLTSRLTVAGWFIMGTCLIFKWPKNDLESELGKPQPGGQIWHSHRSIQSNEQIFQFHSNSVQSLPQSGGQVCSGQSCLLGCPFTWPADWDAEQTMCIPRASLSFKQGGLCVTPEQNAQMQSGWGLHSGHTVVAILRTIDLG